jgi:predicted phosphodiesterase
MKLPIRILSDLHLGHRVSRILRVESLRPLISGAGTVIFNGDTWQELALLFREKSIPMLEELKALCAEEGADTIFLPGNHDPGWPGPGWATLADGKILICHGDTLYAEGSPWSREALRMHADIHALWLRHQAAEHDLTARIQLAREIAHAIRAKEYPNGKKLYQRVLEAVRPPRRAYEILRVWATQADTAADFAEKYFPSAEIVLIGHFHRPGIWHRKGRLILNTGAFMNPCAARWVDYEDGILRYGEILGDGNGPFVRGQALGAWKV